MLSKDFQSKVERSTLGFWCSREELEQLAAEALAKPKRIKKLLGLIFHEAPTVQAQAARVLMRIAEQQPLRLQPYKDFLIQEVANGNHWIVRVCFCKIIPQMKLTARDEKQVVKILIGYLNDESSALKTSSMQALFDLTMLDASLWDDIVPILESLTQTGTPAMRARGRKLCATLYRTYNRRG
jgi:hypothetical protein